MAGKDLLHVDGGLAQRLLLEVRVDVGGGMLVDVADDLSSWRSAGRGRSHGI